MKVSELIKALNSMCPDDLVVMRGEDHSFSPVHSAYKEYAEKEPHAGLTEVYEYNGKKPVANSGGEIVRVIVIE